MSTKTEAKTSDKPQTKERQGGARDGKPQERREGAKAKPEQAEYKRKDEAKPEAGAGEAKPQGDKPQGERRERREGDRKPREHREPREPREGKGERREGAEGEKGEGKPRGDRRPRTEGGEPRPKRERKERPKREYDPEWKSKLVITLETPVPTLIPEKDRLQQPKSETLTNNLKECDRKIKEYEDQIEIQKTKREDFRKKEKEKRDQERLARAENRESKDKEWQDNKTLFEDHKVLKKDVDKISKDKKAIEERLEVVQGKMFELEKQFLTKTAMSIEDVKHQISHLENRQMNEKMTGIEEKKLISDLAVLKKCIPVAEQYSKLLAERSKIRDERKVVVQKLTPILTQKKELDKDLKVILEKRKAEEEANPKKKEEGDKKKEGGKTDEKDENAPKEGEKKERPKSDDPFSKRIDELIAQKKEMYKKKDKLRAEFDEQWDKYHDQRDEIRRIEYIISQKEYLKRIEDIKERKAKELRDQLIQEYLVENTPKEDAATFFKEEISACDLLVNYLTSILPSNRRLFQLEKLDEDFSINVDDLNSQLQADKKLAGLKLKAAPMKEQIVYSQGNKKKHQKKTKPDAKEEEKKPEAAEENFDPESKIVLDIQIRNAFSQIKLEAPVFNKDVEPAIQQVEKKKAELEVQVKTKADEIASIRQNAEKSVPTLEELKEKFKDAPVREKGEKGTHGHKERRGARGGRRGGDRAERGDRTENTNWHGARDRHPKREGDVEKADAEEQAYEDEDSYEAAKRTAERTRQAPKKGPILEGDFPAL